jgi:hypothetical protein
MSTSSVTSIAKLDNVAAAAGGLTLNDRTISGTVPALNFNNGGGGFRGGGGSSGGGGNPSSFGANFDIGSFTVSGVDIGNGELGPLSTGKISSGRTFAAADESSDVALVDSSYAKQNKLNVGSTIAVGGAIGVALGFAGAALVTRFAAPLTATLGSTTGSATPGGARQFTGGQGFPGGSGGFPGGGGGGGTGNPFRGGFQNARQAADTVAVHLSAPVTIGAIVASVVLAILGGLIAGSFGGWRAARLRPAAALSKVA